MCIHVALNGSKNNQVMNVYVLTGVKARGVLCMPFYTICNTCRLQLVHLTRVCRTLYFNLLQALKVRRGGVVHLLQHAAAWASQKRQISCSGWACRFGRLL